MKTKKNTHLSSLSTFRIGGKAEYFCRIKNKKELLRAIGVSKKLKIPFRIIAGGSNVVFPDGKLNGLLIKIENKSCKIQRKRIIVDAGVPLEKVIKKAISMGFRGLETLSGIPGTLGGAIVGNAGAYGHSISEVVEGVEVLPAFVDDVAGEERWLKNKDCKFGYRESIFKKNSSVVLRAVLKLKKGDSKRLRKISRDIIKTRLKKYKPGLRCPGSFFKNVLVSGISKKSLASVDKNKIINEKIPAGYLLEEVGAKGMKLGGIKIADFHGNLFVNTGGAKAADVKGLAKILKDKVQKKFKINLEEEIRYF